MLGLVPSIRILARFDGTESSDGARDQRRKTVVRFRPIDQIAFTNKQAHKATLASSRSGHV
jgi:hypothetical protein